MKKLLLTLFLSSLILTGCGTDVVTPNEEGPTPENPQIEPRIGSGEYTPGNDFEILKYMTKEENYMVSPFSLKMAMMIAANGAEGETKQEILDTFAVEDINVFNEKAKQIIEKYNNTEYVKLNVANSIWLNTSLAGNNIEFIDAYKNIVKEFYSGEVGAEDENTIANVINKWIEEKTNEKIKDVLDSSKKAEFIAALVNTIYFKGEWDTQFEEKSTSKETFTSRDKNKAKIDFMHNTGYYDYYEDKNIQMVKLPYRGNDLSMSFVLPKDEENMDIKSALENMTLERVELSIPKFKTEYELEFNDVLKTMGIEKAFDDRAANFLAMLSNADIYIETVLQKTFIEVDEAGTEAAAATAVVMYVKSGIEPDQEKPKVFKADKPFIYFIMDEATGEILFIGEYAYAK